MFKYFSNGSNLYPLVVLTHIVLLLHEKNVYKESNIYNRKICVLISFNYTASHLLSIKIIILKCKNKK